MKRKLFGLLLVGVSLFTASIPPLRAQVVADGATNTLNNVTNNIVGDVTVGTNGSFTWLILTNNAVLTNSGGGYIGDAVTANSNAVLLTGFGTRWSMGFNLNVGIFGNGNRLLITNGARVENTSGRLGFTQYSSNNQAVVTGAGSFWSNRFELAVGDFGSGNRLVITNGGAVFSSNSVIVGVESGAVSNFLLLSTGGLLTNIYDGVLGAKTNANFNTAFVSDLNSRWLMGGNLHVGSNGAFNRLVISNGALVGDDYGYLGDTGSSSNNETVVTGAGSVWSNRLGLHVGNSGSGNRLVITNGGMARDLDGLLGLNAGSSDNVAIVTGPGSVWTNAYELSVGVGGAGNQLVVTNGAVARSSSGSLGRNSTSSNNMAVVTGAGSLWTNSDFGPLYVGYNGAGNQLVVSNAGVVRNDEGTLGNFSTASNNLAVVTGAGSLWTNNNTLTIGNNGAFNQLVVSNGGVVWNTFAGTIGQFAGSSDNAVVVTGAGSGWTNGSLFVGSGGARNQLLVSAGGTVRSIDGLVGHVETSSNNVAVVTGAGSLWTNIGIHFVGNYSAANQLVLSNGGVMWSGSAIMGNDLSGSNNTAVVTGTGSRWITQVNPFANGSLSVGGYASGNQLVVSNGGVVRSTLGYIGANSTGSSNVAVVTGPGSLWTNQSGFFVGDNGGGNQLVVTNGAVVQTSDGFVGANGGLFGANSGTGNLAVVTGAGSLWTHASNLYVGDHAARNHLVVTNGAVARDYAGYIGFNIEGSNNTAVVTGAGSLWTNESILAVGAIGSGNQMEVRNGGVVQDSIGYIGSNSVSGNNTVLVTDAGSLWTNASALFVGYFGSSNQLLVNNSGKVRVAGSVTLGYADTAINNSVLATGGSLGSVGLNLGNAASRNNSVTLLSGSIWDVGGGPFIWGNAGSNDTLTIDATSALTNIGALWLDENATAFRLTNAPGGYTLNGFTTNQFQFKTNGLDAVVVGNDGTNVQLTVSNFTLASKTGIIGNNASAQSNLVLVAGAGSVWSNSSSLNIGNFGSFNQLVVSNGGALRAGGLVTLGNAAGSTNNSVLAVGGSLSSVGLTLGNVQSRNNSVTLLSGSTWDLGGGVFTWGNAGISDSLTIDGTSGMTNVGALTLDENDTTNLLINGTSLNSLNVGFKTSGLGALVVGNAGTNVEFTISNFIWVGTSGDIGLGATSRSNTVFLSGIGSTWSNSGALKIGNSGAFNQLVISSGAQARDNDGYIGFNSSSSTNEALVTGAGSLWNSRSNLVVGNFGGGNRLTISNAATVSASNNVVVGFNSGAVSNLLSLSTGAWLTNGGDGVLGWNPGASANSAFVSGTNSRWQVGNSLYVGSNGAFNQLVISNAGTVIAASGLSVFTGGGVFVGANASSNNLLSLSAGAQLTNGGNVALGWNTGANSNTVTISGANTFWQMLAYGYVFVGNSGAGNRLVISNGAQLRHIYFTDAHIGYNSAAINNEVFVTGANSLWTVDGNLFVGLFGGGSHLVISDGARVNSGNGWIGPPNSSPPSPVSNNVALVTGANSRWVMSSGLTVGNSGNGSLVISNGGGVDSFSGGIGIHPVFGCNNGALVTGASSYWSNQNTLYVGQGASGSSLVISNGGKVDNNSGFIGSQTTADTNEVVVTGAGSVWYNRSDLYVGYDGSGNRLMITNGGTVFANSGVYVGFGFYTTPSNNLLTVSSGSLIVTNPAGSEVLEIRYGTNVFHSGAMDVDRLRLTNSAGFFTFNGGTLKTKGTTNSNGQLFTVGNGTSTAILELVGNGLHTFNNGLVIANNATLRGNGSISGTLTVAIGGTLSPGTSVGKIVLSNSPALLGNVIMEISRNGAVLTNDQIQVAGPLTYGGSLTVSNLGPTALAVGNNFKLFAASSYSGSFSILSLPAPGPGLGWTNKLLLDGSIEVIAAPTVPAIVGIGVSGTNVIITGTNGTPNAPYAVLTSTNVALSLINWTSIITNQFDSSGNFSFTNGFASGIPQRFFRLRTP